MSVKTRIGVETPDTWHDILDIYNKFQLEELIIHPRIRTDYYRGDINKAVILYAIMAIFLQGVTLLISYMTTIQTV